MDLFKNLKIVLNNENGGPNVEQVVGIAVSMGVGAGLFVFGAVEKHWFENKAADTVKEIHMVPKTAWDLTPKE